MQNSFKVSTCGLSLRSTSQICGFILKQTDDVQVLCQKAPLTYDAIVLSDMNYDLGTTKVSYKKCLKLHMEARYHFFHIVTEPPTGVFRSTTGYTK